MKIFGIKVKKKGKEYFWETAVKAENVKTTDELQFVSKKKITEWNNKPGDEDPVSTNTVSFDKTDQRNNIESGEKLSVMFSKVQKFFQDLKAVAFSGNYKDLEGKPEFGTAACDDTTDSLEVVTEGYVTDARATKTVNDKFGGLKFYEDATGKYVVGADAVPKKLGSGDAVKITHAEKSNYRIESLKYDVDGTKYKENQDYVFDIKSVISDYQSLTIDNFHFCVTKSNVYHYIASGYNIDDPRAFTAKKIYNADKGELRIEDVSGLSRQEDSRIRYTITEFDLLIIR